MGVHRRVTTICALAAAVVLLIGCAAEDAVEETSAALPPDPLEQMSIAFQDSPSVSELKPLLDNAFAATDTPTTDENYSRAGSVLVTFRKEYGINEMDILQCIPSRQSDPRISEHTFPNVAAVCVTDLSSGG